LLYLNCQKLLSLIYGGSFSKPIHLLKREGNYCSPFWPIESRRTHLVHLGLTRGAGFASLPPHSKPIPTQWFPTGRRALAEKSLAQSLGRPSLIALATTILARRARYYAALEAANKSNKITEWLAWFAGTTIEYANNARISRLFLGKPDFRERTARRQKVNRPAFSPKGTCAVRFQRGHWRMQCGHKPGIR
jgi:hypothetical protein